MSSIPEEVSNHLAAQLVAVVPAANADHLADRLAEQRHAETLSGTASGWDSYEVWRRFIKDARARRVDDSK